ncbi:MAG: VTT domain-containing protein [Aestuariivirga sp.]
MDYFSALVSNLMNSLSVHPIWVWALVFGVSLGEALLILGLFVPSTVVLVGAGTLVGAGKLDFWPVLAATVMGCVLGDQLSYFAGRWYGDRLKTMWPLNRFPTLLDKGEEYVRLHGGKSIAIGRFIPGIKAVVPGVAGMFGMNQTFFTLVNIISGVVWALAHILPGILLGQALTFASDLSGRLLIALLVLFAVLAIGGWSVRMIAGLVDPHRHAVQRYFSGLAQTSRFASMRRFGEALSPENPNSILLALGILAGLLAVAALIDLISGLIIHHAVGEFDHSLLNFFSELRSVPGDEVFLRLSMLGDERVLYWVAAVPIVWLALQRQWRAAWSIVIAVAVAKLILLAFSFALAPQGYVANTSDFRFPSAHVLLAGTIFGSLGICSARGLSRWNQALLISCFAMLVVAIGFTRLYLGVSWFSDVFGGILIASIIVVMVSIAISTVPFTKVRPLWLLSTSLAVFVIAAGFNLSTNFDREVEHYQPLSHFVSYSQPDFLDRGWAKLPDQRINLIGHASDEFAVQWIGSLPALEEALINQNYKVWGRWGWRDMLPYLNQHAKIADIAPRPLVHAGLRAKLTATLVLPDAPDQRFVLRAFQSNVMIEGTETPERVYLLTLRQEAAHNNLGLYSLPADHPASPEDLAKLIAALQADPNVETLGEHQVGANHIVIMKPKS